MFVLSMLLPAGGSGRGYQVAHAALWGATMRSWPCIVGLAANALFILTAILLIVRLARRRPRPTFSLVFRASLPAAAMMLAAWGWMQWLWLREQAFHSWLTPAPLAWVASGLLLSIGAARLRTLDAQRFVGRGFEVIPVRAGDDARDAR
jgi:hypothetical protein